MERINQHNRKAFLKTMPDWFHNLMNYKPRYELKNAKKEEQTGKDV
jgi:hypothetical protein